MKKKPTPSPYERLRQQRAERIDPPLKVSISEPSGTVTKTGFVYQGHPSAIEKRAKAAAHLDRWRLSQGLDSPRLDRESEINRAAAAGVRAAMKRRKPRG